LIDKQVARTVNFLNALKANLLANNLNSLHSNKL
jgi:hypothetical protein